MWDPSNCYPRVIARWYKNDFRSAAAHDWKRNSKSCENAKNRIGIAGRLEKRCIWCVLEHNSWQKNITRSRWGISLNWFSIALVKFTRVFLPHRLRRMRHRNSCKHRILIYPVLDDGNCGTVRNEQHECDQEKSVGRIYFIQILILDKMPNMQQMYEGKLSEECGLAFWRVMGSRCVSSRTGWSDDTSIFSGWVGIRQGRIPRHWSQSAWSLISLMAPFSFGLILIFKNWGSTTIRRGSARRADVRRAGSRGESPRRRPRKLSSGKWAGYRAWLTKRQVVAPAQFDLPVAPLHRLSPALASYPGFGRTVANKVWRSIDVVSSRETCRSVRSALPANEISYDIQWAWNSRENHQFSRSMKCQNRNFLST